MTDCATRYPILLVHGVSGRDFRELPGYWGRIPQTLEAHGARVFFGRQDGWATVEDNAAALALRVKEIQALTGADKVHVIAHSKGGLDARAMAALPGMAGRLASLTTISTPHHGSETMDALTRLPRWLYRAAGLLINGWYRLIGDKNPDFCSVCFQFTTAWAREFNAAHPLPPGVLCRSCAGVMASSRADALLCWQHAVVRAIEGANDGLVSVRSARWGEFQPLWVGAGGRGLSHMDEIDFRRRPLLHRGERVDVPRHYVALAAGLKELGL